MPLKLVPPRPGKSPNWTIRGTVCRICVDETTGTANKKLAEAIRVKREKALQDEAVFGARASRTFSAAALSYIEIEQPSGTQRTAVIGRERQDGTISPCLVTDFGEKLVSSIEQTDVDEVVRKRFRNAAPGTINRLLYTPLIAVLMHAARRKWCDRPMLQRPKVRDRSDRWATFEEADRLLAASAPHTRPLLMFLMFTGARMAEALELDWADVDLPQRWLVFRHTKRGEKRGVPIHPQLVAVLANLPERTGRVFLADTGRPYADRNRQSGGQIRSAWMGACRRAGVKDLTPHDLRHSFSTWLTMTGVHEQVRDEIMGHASTSMGRRYAHIPRQALFDAVDQMQFVPTKTEPFTVLAAMAETATRGKSVETDRATPGEPSDFNALNRA